MNYEQLINNVNNYRTLDEDWDCYGAVKPNKDIIDFTIEMINHLKKLEIQPPKSVMGNESSITLYWAYGCNVIEILIDNVNNYSYLILNGNRYFGEDDIQFDKDVLTDKLVSTLKNIKYE